MNKEEAPSFRIIHRSEPKDRFPKADRRREALHQEAPRQEVLLQEAIPREVTPTETALILPRRRVETRKEN